MTDRELDAAIRQVARHDGVSAEALGRIYAEMGGGVLSFICLRCADRHAAEDLLHDTFLHIYDNADKYRVFTNPRAWILTAARNLTLSYLRQSGRTVELGGLPDNTLPPQPDETDRAVDSVFAGSLLDILSGSDREIVTLRTVYGFKHRETAKILGMPAGTVSWRYKESLGRLRAAAGIKTSADKTMKGEKADEKQ